MQNGLQSADEDFTVLPLIYLQANSQIFWYNFVNLLEDARWKTLVSVVYIWFWIAVVITIVIVNVCVRGASSKNRRQF